MRLYNAICAWIEATALEKLAGASPEEPHPEGNNFANVEHAHSFTTEPELHAGWRPDSIEEYLDRRIGFRPNPEG